MLLVDSIPQSIPLCNVFHDINSIAPNILELIEVIKGATAIYGNGSDGGIINYITKKFKKDKPFSNLNRIENTCALTRFENGVGGEVY
ncbi:MAG: hypothetical protein ABI045_06035 [Flavobacteriales bacterium]